MSVTATVRYACNGCNAVEEVAVDRLKSRFHGFNGKDYGFGVWKNEIIDAEHYCPEGWMAFDPYTRCCYCPNCIAEIWPEPEERQGLGIVLVIDDPRCSSP